MTILDDMEAAEKLGRARRQPNLEFVPFSINTDPPPFAEAVLEWRPSSVYVRSSGQFKLTRLGVSGRMSAP